MGLRAALGFDSTRDRASELPQIDPRAHIPNTNPPVGTVGPDVNPTGGVGYQGRVMHAEAWAGWPDDWGTPWYETSGGEWSGFGYGRHNPDAYLGRVSTVMTCVDRNSSQLASFPLYGVHGTSTEALPRWARNPMPGMYADWSDFALEVTNALQLDGEAIVWAADRYNDGYPARFMVLPARDVVVDYDRDRGRMAYWWGDEPLDLLDICHIRYQKVAGSYRGIGPLRWASAHLASAAALADYASDIARHGVWAILKHPANLNERQRDDAKTSWMQGRAGNPAAPAVVSGGWEFDTLTLSPTDMALLDLRTLDDQRIAAAFRLQPYLVGVESPGSMTYDNTQWIGDHHWRIALRPIAKKIATALSLWALPGEHRLEFNRDEYTYPGFGERANAYSTMHNIVNADGEHAMTVDEIRVRERFDPKQPDRLPGTDAALIGDNP